MAIYSLSLRSIGRSTHQAGTAGAHVAYITRAAACRTVLAENMPSAEIGARGGEARAWLDEAEAGDRKNARVADRVMLALPVELDASQRVELVRAFVGKLTDGRAVPYLAAFHDREADADNPHCHLLLRDRGVETGRRVVGLSERGAVDRVRLAWEQATNAALEAAGSAARIDRRSLLAQGIHREPARHEGPAAQQIAAKGQRSTKLRRIEKGMRPRAEAMHAARRDREARETRKARIAAGEAHRAAQEAARADRERRDRERAAERRRAVLEAREAREAGRVAQKAEKALRDAQIAAERQEATRAAEIEAAIARSRARVLRGRGLANTATGFLRGVRQGWAMLEPFPQDELRRATRHLLDRATDLRAAWDAFRRGRHDGRFAGVERGFTEAGTNLAGMHMVLAPPRRLTGAQLDEELERMAELEAFPDQGLLRPAIGAARGRIAQIERYFRTPMGEAELAERRAQERRAEDERHRQAQRQAAMEKSARERFKEIRRAHLAFVRPLVQRARHDPDIRRILDPWIGGLDRPAEAVALDPGWDRIVPEPGSPPVWYWVEARVAELDRERSRSAPKPEPPRPAPRPEPERHRPDQRPSSQQNSEPRPRSPDPGSGPRGPGF